MRYSVIITLYCANECEIPGNPEIHVILMCISMMYIAARMK